MVVGVGALLVLSTDPVRVAELPQRAGLSKEAIVVALRWPEGAATRWSNPVARRRSRLARALPGRQLTRYDGSPALSVEFTGWSRRRLSEVIQMDVSRVQ